ncbi:metal binding Ada-like protein [Chitinophaga niastensis]|uniref:Metal binding Ada-like protein n=1 Tax=Chitinophaga niastensis TaxID=536980 RepID=A0A2P8HEV0_CHINA|nr:Ada metal-binding domain-containing protein [Chitinophaga niastensis]PSL44748.1 metal binding Ada-like protein [Chitinophaga niastensis]
MIHHIKLGNTQEERRKVLRTMIRGGAVCLGGYKKAKIYGLLRCTSGMRMKAEHRVFFRDEEEAIKEGYRPCGHCLPEKYKLWKAGLAWAGNVQPHKN